MSKITNMIHNIANCSTYPATEGHNLVYAMDCIRNMARDAEDAIKKESIYHLNIDADLFKLQRKMLGLAISIGQKYSEHFTEDGKLMIESLQGIEALLDEIADQAHDLHGLQTLNLGDDL